MKYWFDGVDHEEKFTLVAKMNTIKIILSLATPFGWESQQFDVKNVVLHGHLERSLHGDSSWFWVY